MQTVGLLFIEQIAEKCAIKAEKQYFVNRDYWKSVLYIAVSDLKELHEIQHCLLFIITVKHLL